MQWNLIPRKSLNKDWQRFIDEGWNHEVLWNMDCNDDVRDRLKAHVSKISSDWWKGDQRAFEVSLRCPYAMRDAYQLVTWLAKQESDPVTLFARLQELLGDLTDQEGRKLVFDYLLPDEIEAPSLEEYDFDDLELEEVPF